MGMGHPLENFPYGQECSHVKADAQEVAVGKGGVGRLKLFKNYVGILTLVLYLSRGNAAEKNSFIVVRFGSCLGHACGR